MILESMTLKNGHTIPLKSLNLLIGPNNSGKSSFLSEIKSLNPGMILDSTNPPGLDVKQIQSHLESVDNFDVPAPNGGRWRADDWDKAGPIVEREIATVGPTILKRVWSSSTVMLDGRKRLSIVDDKEYHGIEAEPKNSFAILRREPQLRYKVQEQLEKVLPGKYFALWNPQPTILRAYVSERPPVDDIEYFDSPMAHRFFEENATPLSEFSDGIKAYLGIVVTLVTAGDNQYLIDEPEAFLHPSLCFTLGATLAELSRQMDTASFCATHSPYFLKGCLSRSPSSVSVTRLEYDSPISRANTLETDDLLSLIHDPLLNNIGVIEGLFHSRVVVTEGDSDRAFYSEINARLSTALLRGIRDCVFINAQNKQTISKVVELFRKISIPCAAISDIDVLKEGGTNFARLLTAIDQVGARRDALALLRTRVNESLNEASASRADATVSYEGLLAQVHAAREEGKSARDCLATLRGSTNPPDYKRLGGLDLLEGDDRIDADNLISQLAAAGWFVVEVGELENWLPSLEVGSGKQGWLLRVFAAMGSDPSSADYLNPPSELNDVWLFIQEIGDWFAQLNAGR